MYLLKMFRRYDYLFEIELLYGVLVTLAAHSNN